MFNHSVIFRDRHVALVPAALAWREQYGMT
jgi:hypothetical protein